MAAPDADERCWRTIQPSQNTSAARLDRLGSSMRVVHYACARMDPISFLRQLYSLDTLDTRFTTSARTPLKLADADPAQATKPQDEKASTPLPAGASPSRWRTPEFYFYALTFLVVVPQMFKAVVDVSQREYQRTVQRVQRSFHIDN